ncbi:MAG TPA: SH3 domain-containing protein [Saprospiraceae bacterium]|nr:SH3 domain-containing protein [Saprospiraceae bacterium]
MNAINLKSKNPIIRFSWIVVLLTMLFGQPLQAKQTVDICQTGEVLYVWAKTGLNLRQEPSIHSKRLAILVPGSQVKVLGFTQERYAIKTLRSTEDEQNPYIIKGNWILVQVGDIQGFVLDTYLLPIPTPKAGESMKHYLISMSERVADLGTEDDDEYAFSATTPKNISIQYESGEYYQNITVTIPNFTIEDGFVFYNFFNNLQGRAVSDDSEVYMFKNWKSELSVFDEATGEVNFQVIDDQLVISEVMMEGC